jgi:hypothetical protein
MTLAGDTFSPITSEFGLVELPLETLAEWRLAFDTRIQAGRGGKVSSKHLSGSFSSLVQSVLPLTAVLRPRMVFVATRSPWTAVFDSGWQGGDEASFSLPADQLGCRAIRVVSSPQVNVGGRVRRYGARMFELFGPEPRTISVANDGGRWRMDLMGTLLPGEDPSWFAPRSVKDRFREEHLVALLQSMGLDVFNEEFYAGEGVLIEHYGAPNPPGYREYTLEEVQADWRA